MLTLLWFSRDLYISVLLARPSTEQPALVKQWQLIKNQSATICKMIY